jgi:nardilysin
MTIPEETKSRINKTSHKNNMDVDGMIRSSQNNNNNNDTIPTTNGRTKEEMTTNPMLSTTTSTTTTTTPFAKTQTGPDLHASRSKIDPKLYRHITLPNGIQALLIQDTIAMQQQQQQTEESFEEEEDDASKSSNGSYKSGASTTSEDEHDTNNSNNNNNTLRDAACCILVGAGSANDPPTCPGLAHFLEHLLFMGSAKYPGENEFSNFVTQHGGYTNAYTEWEYTSYVLEIPARALFGALDRLAQFFIQPLLLENAVQRELQSIESEFQMHKHSDSTRQRQLLCSISHIQHPMAKFAWGNLRSLSYIPQKLGTIDPMVELRTFYQKQYHAANLRIVLQGAYTLDTLQRYMETCFAPVPPPHAQHHPEDSSHPKPVVTTPMFPWSPSILGTVFRVVPIQDRHSISILWQLPPQFSNWKSKPVEFLSHLLGHEGRGSIFSVARQKYAWATACEAGSGEDGCDAMTTHALFHMSFTLTQAGMRHWKQLVQIVYQYLGLLRYTGQKKNGNDNKNAEGGWPSWMFPELQRIHQVAYQYQDETHPGETVENLVEYMAPHYQLPTERLLDGAALLFEFDDATIQELLDEYMTPSNSIIVLTSSQFGSPADYEHVVTAAAEADSVDTIITNLVVADSIDGDDDEEDEVKLNTSILGDPQLEPMFETQFWCHKISQLWIDKFTQAWEPSVPTIPELFLPSPNPFVPDQLDLKSVPLDDADHPLLNASLKLCIRVGKTKQWFPATVIRYNSQNNKLLLSFEDEDEQWHALDEDTSYFTAEALVNWRMFEGTMDDKTVKFRIVGLSTQSSKGGGLRMFGDESDLDVEMGTQFPPIPPPSTRLPVQISDSNALKMWWLQDRKFKRPIAELRVQIICGKANLSPTHRAASDLMCSLCSDALLETSYLAAVGELGSSIETADDGFVLRFHGFDDKLLDLFKKTMSVILSFRGKRKSLPECTNTERLAVCLESLERRYKNSGMSAAKLLTQTRLQALRPNIWSSHKKWMAIQQMDTTCFAQTISEMMENVSVEALFHGNANRLDAEKVKAAILTMLDSSGGADLPRKKYPPHSMLRIPCLANANTITVPSKDPDEPNRACEMYIQVGKDNVRERVLMDLLMHIMDEPIYDDIRTKEQFGYDVYCDVRWSYGIIGAILHVTTNNRSAAEVATRLDTFLKDFRETLVSMKKEDFNEYVVGLAKQKLDIFNSLSEETDSYWAEIRDGRFAWESWREEALCLREIKQNDIVNAFDSWFLPGKERNILITQVIGAGDPEASRGRPSVDTDGIPAYVDQQVEEFHKICKKQYWGRVNCKLF